MNHPYNEDGHPCRGKCGLICPCLVENSGYLLIGNALGDELFQFALRDFDLGGVLGIFSVVMIGLASYIFTRDVNKPFKIMYIPKNYIFSLIHFLVA